METVKNPRSGVGLAGDGEEVFDRTSREDQEQSYL
jgi:hypothetical protein